MFWLTSLNGLGGRSAGEREGAAHGGEGRASPRVRSPDTLGGGPAAAPDHLAVAREPARAPPGRVAPLTLGHPRPAGGEFRGEAG